MSSAPGLSLFQSAECLQVNQSRDLAEEEEELEDQRRRHEELGNLLQNAFDDLDEDETTIDSTTNFQSELLDGNAGQNDCHKLETAPPQSHAACETEISELKNLLSSRTHELENIKKIANEERKKRDEVQKRLMIAEAELDRALAAKKNTHELLVESKEKCSNLESTITKVRHEKKTLETENHTLLGKLETAQTLLSDVQHKYDMVERDLNKHNERNAELRRKQSDDRHRAEIEMMQQQLDQVMNKLEKKTAELDAMNARYHALQSSHEMMLVEKATRINDLNSALNEAQHKCEQLLGQQDYRQENIRLQKHVASLQEQIVSMEKTISTLQHRLDQTTAELDVMDNVLHQHQNDVDTPRRLSQAYTQGCAIGSTPLNTVDRVAHLKDELYRALANVKSKRDDVRKLQQTLDERNAEVRKLRDEENHALVQIATLKEDKLRLENRLKVLEQEYEQLRTQHSHTTDDAQATSNVADAQLQVLREELQQLREEKSVLEQRQTELQLDCEKHESERLKLDSQLKNVEIDMEELKQEHESMRLNYEQMLKENQQLRARNTADGIRLELERHKFLLKDAQAECDRLKNLYVEISGAKEVLAFELDKQRATDGVKELQEQREKVANLQRALQLAEVKSSELAKILETEKLCHERDVKALREKMEKERMSLVNKMAKDNANQCNKCIDYLAEITKFEIQNLKLANINASSKQQIDDLSKELSSSNALNDELRQKLKLSDQQEMLIRELKTKAHQFEEYIKSHNSNSSSGCSDAATSPPPTVRSGSDKSVSTSPELLQDQVKRIEARIRDEMAKIFAIELKRCQAKVRHAEEQNLALQQEHEILHSDLQQRHSEVELLKQAILAERERMTALLQQKDSEGEAALKEHRDALRKCRDELQAKTQRLNEITKELEERQTQIEAERQSMKAVMAQWEKQRRSVDAIDNDWRAKLEEMRRAHDSAIVSWQKKYSSAKRTIENYKRYAEDQEAHMRKEYDRLKLEYDTSLAKIEVRMKEALAQRQQKGQHGNIASGNQRN